MSLQQDRFEELSLIYFRELVEICILYSYKENFKPLKSYFLIVINRVEDKYIIYTYLFMLYIAIAYPPTPLAHKH